MEKCNGSVILPKIDDRWNDHKRTRKERGIRNPIRLSTPCLCLENCCLPGFDANELRDISCESDAMRFHNFIPCIFQYQGHTVACIRLLADCERLFRFLRIRLNTGFTLKFVLLFKYYVLRYRYFVHSYIYYCMHSLRFHTFKFFVNG